jgi:hypothetical protein
VSEYAGHPNWLLIVGISLVVGHWLLDVARAVPLAAQACPARLEDLGELGRAARPTRPAENVGKKTTFSSIGVQHLNLKAGIARN